MFKPLIRLLSFFAKEVNEIRRQPRLVLSLILGPFVILMLFGAGYQGDQHNLRTVLVVPDQSLNQADLDALRKSSLNNFQIISVDKTPDKALQELSTGQIDLVQVFPPNLEQQVMQGTQPQIQFKYNDINPLNEQWLQYLSYAQINAMNQAILLRSASTIQGDSKQANTQLSDTAQQLDRLNSGASAVDKAQTQQSLRQAKVAVGVLALNPLLAAQVTGDTTSSPEQTRQNMLQLQQNLDQVDQSISNGTLDQERDRIKQTHDQVVQLQQLTQHFSAVPPAAIAAPLSYTTQNISGKKYDLTVFYVPRVLALLIQHIAVTLGALALVRERILGAVEIFRVAPVTSIQVVSGKYLGYTLFIGIIAAVLTALMPLLNVPLAQDIWSFVGVILLLTLASIGIGFLISVISTSDSQAIQLSMLVLLFSIFFSGFFLPLDNFGSFVQYLANLLPLTHGINGLQAVMLQGTQVNYFDWVWMGGIAAVAYIVAMIASHFQFRRV